MGEAISTGCRPPLSAVRLLPGSGQQRSDPMVAPVRGEKEAMGEAVTDTM